MSPLPQLGPLEAVVDEVVTSWPDVKARSVFGHRGYVRTGSMFGFLADGGVAAKATGRLADELMARDGATVFAHTGMPMKQWVVLPLRTDAEVDYAVDALNRAYDAAV